MMGCKILGCKENPIGLELARELFDASEEEVLNYSKYCKAHAKERVILDRKNKEFDEEERKREMEEEENA